MEQILIKMKKLQLWLLKYTLSLYNRAPHTASHTYRNNHLSPGEAFISSHHAAQLCFLRSPSAATWSWGLKSGQMPLLSLGMAVPRRFREDWLVVFISWWWQVPLWWFGFSAYRNSSAKSEFWSIKLLNFSAERPQEGARDRETLEKTWKYQGSEKLQQPTSLMTFKWELVFIHSPNVIFPVSTTSMALNRRDTPRWVTPKAVFSITASSNCVMVPSSSASNIWKR